MEGIKSFLHIFTLLSIVLSVSITPVYGQINTSCTASMISSFTPCLNYIAQGSGGNASAPATPSTECCSSLKSLASNGMNCACLIVTGSVPFQLPINRTLAISLPKACKLDGVPVQCDASSSPLPAPGPASFGLAPSPLGAIPNGGSTVGSPSQAPESNPTLESPPVDSDSPTTSVTGTRPVVDPSSAAKICHISVVSPVLFMLVGIMVLNYN
ncbi:hypothetical protein C5167_017337 [Papaver somniferum]|uniref:Bifunctional inhibitor/plant lipid transfer protein/seed storage helical domain-containing protein n=1 Tax=Papaver somniferum TaxID=3469 RepID=A0A4Y7IMG8_PAPSO|nr:non-specific lipid transfer protein GPI-anchored 2-like [Papaver somniferum]RZC48912.1 hypothetical protein C5167_017337 [Papaver somniferum]